MRDQKRFVRELKREFKRLGNRQRRNYLKDVNNEPDDFSFGRRCSEAMNEKPRRPRRKSVERASNERNESLDA
jgi:hypothetical protein